VSYGLGIDIGAFIRVAIQHNGETRMLPLDTGSTQTPSQSPPSPTTSTAPAGTVIKIGNLCYEPMGPDGHGQPQIVPCS
jgi:hypothetical protein